MNTARPGQSERTEDDCKKSEQERRRSQDSADYAAMVAHF
jgi:hypothetical protein